MSEQTSDAICWDVLTIGHVSRNRFWGEADERARRAPRCTCTLIRTAAHTILVDPSLPPEQMAQVLDERTGLTPEAVDTVFLTHFHGDHRVGMEAFPRARWCMAREERELWATRLPETGQDRALLERIMGIDDVLAPGIALLSTPGHTPGHTSLRFASDGLRVVVAGDAVMTRDFFRARAVYFNTEDTSAALASLDQIAALADIIVPGHDNAFVHRPSQNPS